ncbi:hypothetical protein K2X92_03595 [Candidatus Gracilibacteria bacterium]|nr:hypothetical protein [Candidatus Gracilibacteria bacterium]
MHGRLFLFFLALFSPAFLYATNSFDLNNLPWYIDQGIGLIWGFRIATVFFMLVMITYFSIKSRNLLAKENLVVFLSGAFLYVFATTIHGLIVMSI